jgi:hypothetical protein
MIALSFIQDLFLIKIYKETFPGFYAKSTKSGRQAALVWRLLTRRQEPRDLGLLVSLNCKGSRPSKMAAWRSPKFLLNSSLARVKNCVFSVCQFIDLLGERVIIWCMP